MLNIGTLAPSFEARLHTGEVFRLQALRGQFHLILYFYPKDFTYGCTKEACSFRDRFDDIKALGSMILGASPDSPETHQRFAREHRLAFPLISDPHHELAKRYEASAFGGLRMLRVTYIIDLNGFIRGAFHHELLISNHWDKSLEILKTLEKATV